MQTQSPINRLLKATCLALFAIMLPGFIVGQDAPTAIPDIINVNEGETATVLSDGSTSVLTNDSDPNSDPLTAALVDNVSHGSLTLFSDGTFSYTHDDSETTSDSFTYTANDDEGLTSATTTVTINITPQNDPPVATDDAATVLEGASVNIDLTDNVSDDGTVVFSTLAFGAATNGSVTNNNDGTITYTHNDSETTGDSFTYTVNDNDGATSNTATITITVTPENDPPVATDDAATVLEGASVNIDLTDNVSDDGTVVFSTLAFGAATNGSVTNNNDGTITYTHN
ncbi:MAG: Ig-like domain-containing protein, partial [Bacteroidales bacterium]|nr:Ig-like domain-containing protein [Bacteroidales bacterium]